MLSLTTAVAPEVRRPSQRSTPARWPSASSRPRPAACPASRAAAIAAATFGAANDVPLHSAQPEVKSFAGCVPRAREARRLGVLVGPRQLVMNVDSTFSPPVQHADPRRRSSRTSSAGRRARSSRRRPRSGARGRTRRGTAACRLLLVPGRRDQHRRARHPAQHELERPARRPGRIDRVGDGARARKRREREADVDHGRVPVLPERPRHATPRSGSACRRRPARRRRRCG